MYKFKAFFKKGLVAPPQSPSWYCNMYGHEVLIIGRGEEGGELRPFTHLLSHCAHMTVSCLTCNYWGGGGEGVALSL
jgi:hypothetical protein